MTQHQESDRDDLIEPPPVLRRWTDVYWAVLLYLFTIIVLLYWITNEFSY